MELHDIKGLGDKKIAALNKLNIFSVEDLLRYYPYRYNVYRVSNELVNNETITICADVASEPTLFFRGGKSAMNFKMVVNGRLIKCVIYNRHFMKKFLKVGKGITVIGKYDHLKNTFIANNIKLYKINGSEVESVYHLVSGIKKPALSSSIQAALNVDVMETIPDYLNQEYGFIDINEAIKEIHNPTNIDLLKKAKLKLKYEELFNFMFKINMIKHKNQIMDNFIIKNIKDSDIDDVLSMFPFKMTNDQMKAIKEIAADFNKEKRMNRLVMGDVGCGKTYVAFASILLNHKCGYQSAFLAPTEVLARQHFESFKKLNTNLNCALLVGSLKVKEKKTILDDLASGKIDLLIGTHAMLEDNVIFNNIGLIVTDEQHRFGVNQRKTLQNKGVAVDVLYMSATPIPRTYALTIYGDMDISMILEKPGNRKEIKTSLYDFNSLKEVLLEMDEEIKSKHQVYVVAPLIEENDETNLSDINKIYELLTKHFKNTQIDILHGKMKSDEKDIIMNKFKSGETKILISTTVIEVGVDVSNATMMVIFNAERFGLATLHQLRGRVGRNEIESKCILISDKETERLKVLCESNDGFYISERDFEIRGSGDLFGIRQSGDMVFKIADLRSDFKILTQCKKDSNNFIINNIENNFREYPVYQDLVKKLMNND